MASTAAQLAGAVEACIKRSPKPSRLHAKAAHARALAAGLAADTFLANRLVELYSRSGLPCHALRAFRSLPRPNEYSYNAALSAACRGGDLDAARELLGGMPRRNAVSWNTVISALARSSDRALEAVEMYGGMRAEGLLPTHFTLASVLSACGAVAALEDGRRCHGTAVKVGLDANQFVENALLGMYTKCGRVGDAVRLFDGMSRPNEVSFTAMMGGLAQTGSVDDALRLFARMCRSGVPVDPVSVSSVLGACAQACAGEYSIARAFRLGQSVHALVITKGFGSDQHVGNSLIDMYAKCMKMDEAVKVFESLPNITIVSWNILITGFGHEGSCIKAMELLNLMQEAGFEPNEVTYGCSHSGLVDKAMAFFNSMENSYGIIPLAEHYTCLIDALGRAGRFVEVETLIHKMPCKDDHIIWEVLLAACVVHHNAELGKCAAEHLFRIDPKNPSPYVLLSNIYASLGRHSDASAVRALMSSRGVVKGRGYSWIDQKDGVRAFMVADDLGIDGGEFTMFSNENSIPRATEVYQDENCVG
ncbi:hypothetical protein E2562_029466 [Oryza meyeriana var. granulata]|uniref:Pentacotripeptide-repeat region of PRORP domain-containing protein n=1 Tax=Oryza meyeriana var. granulata TaxID=110450 RepID=A0A6G1E2Z9_9ORYZ|nr:hypothetical protein E2562_029466 [Oryza meyeriana var. granulata]